MRVRAAVLLVLVTGLSGAQNLRAQRVTVTPSLGFSQDFRSETSNRWNAGVTAGAAVFLESSRAVTVGVRVAFHKWSADAAGWLADEPEAEGFNYTIQSSSGAQTVFEIAPTVRMALRGGEGRVRVAAQLGAALAMVSADEVSVSGTFTSPGSSGQNTFTYPGESHTGFGAQFGLPITIGRTLQITPTYTVYRANDMFHHVGISLGAPFRL